MSSTNFASVTDLIKQLEREGSGPTKQKTLTHKDIMWFGKHKGKLLSEVPASYLLWLWNEGKYKEKDEMAVYIYQNLTNLEKECPDTITKRRA